MLRGIEVGQLDGTEMDKKDASILRKYGSIDGYKKTRAGRCAKNWNLLFSRIVNLPQTAGRGIH